jgi:Flp pilus assembly CpaF family ATPase
MYAGEVAAPGVLSTTLRGLIEGGTLTPGQATKLSQLINERRTLVVFGDRATGKSTLLNALFELVPVDERFVAMERGPDLPALKERSFCVRLTIDDDTDIAALFAKARRMQPGRLVIGEIHREEMRHVFALLAEMPTVGGLATLRAETVHKAVAVIEKSVGDGDPASGRAALAEVRPVFAHMHSDEKGRPRLAALWSVAGLEGTELELEEVRTSATAASQLVAEA